MDNFSVRSERNFHNLAAKPKRMHLLDEPNGYASAMVKNSLSHQMRFTVQKLEEELCAAGNPHVLQIKLLFLIAFIFRKSRDKSFGFHDDCFAS
ncbi:MAG: hypothetical protein SPG58_01670 [Collinsella sp.]|nr:hypothetical protein [Collinsella sp.]